MFVCATPIGCDLPIMVYGVPTDAEGRPVAVEVYPGNTADPSTVPDQAETIEGRFGQKRVVSGYRGGPYEDPAGRSAPRVCPSPASTH